MKNQNENGQGDSALQISLQLVGGLVACFAVAYLIMVAIIFAVV